MVAAASSDLVIDTMLGELGFIGENARLARLAIEAAGLTNPRKTRIASGKLGAVRDELRARFVLLCARASCRQSNLTKGRKVLDAARPTDCAVCSGSTNATDVDRAVATLIERGLCRVVVVGGAPSTREELRDLVAGRLELRLVSGNDRRTARAAKADLNWAHIVAIWGGTELDHKVSELYTQRPAGRVVVCRRRGIAAMAATLIEAVQDEHGNTGRPAPDITA